MKKDLRKRENIRKRASGRENMKLAWGIIIASVVLGVILAGGFYFSEGGGVTGNQIRLPGEICTSASDCNDNDPCTRNQCNDVNGTKRCVFVPLSDGSTCTTAGGAVGKCVRDPGRNELDCVINERCENSDCVPPGGSSECARCDGNSCDYEPDTTPCGDVQGSGPNGRCRDGYCVDLDRNKCNLMDGCSDVGCRKFNCELIDLGREQFYGCVPDGFVADGTWCGHGGWLCPDRCYGGQCVSCSNQRIARTKLKLNPFDRVISK